MLYIVDGTGDADESVYRKNMQGGMCDRMAKEYRGTYYRGPTGPGLETYAISEKVHKDILGDLGFREQPLYLAGHSRGGAAVIHVAQLLKKAGYWVDAMFLFDAVDRTVSKKQVQLIPRNVRRVFHARRAAHLGAYYEVGARHTAQDFFVSLHRQRQTSDRPANGPVIGTFKVTATDGAPRAREEVERKRQTALNYQRLDDAMKLRMRVSAGKFSSGVGGVSMDFGNCGTELESACTVEESQCTYAEEFFLGSHGAIGGSFIGLQDEAWITKADQLFYDAIRSADMAAVSDVKCWMEKHFESMKLEIHDSVRTAVARPK